jgi:tetratricopeptide (TPR) repeat protein
MARTDKGRGRALGEPTRAAVAPAVESGTPARRRAPRALALLGLLVVLAVALRLRTVRGGESIPDPVTPAMLAPVRRALTAARDAVRAAPDSAAAWGELAEACDAHHLYPEAEVAYRRARRIEPGSFRWVYGLALVRDFQGAPAAEVAGLFAAAVEREPRYPPARLRTGDALVRQGRLEEARTAYEAALALDPDFAMAHRNLGQTLLALDDVAGARAELERAAALAPEDSVGWSSLAQVRWRDGDEAGATRAEAEASRTQPVYGVPDPVRHALETRNLSPLACDRRAAEHESRGEWRAALADLEALAESTPEVAAVHWRLGRCLRALGEREQAATALERALALAPEHLGALLERAGLAEDQADLARAAELYRRATELAPGGGNAWKRLGGCLGPLGDLPGALAAFERAASLGVRDAELLHNWGAALARTGRDAEACERLRAALALEPDNAATHFSLAGSLAELGQREEAIQHLERAQALDPSLPTAEPLAALRAGR